MLDSNPTEGPKGLSAGIIRKKIAWMRTHGLIAEAGMFKSCLIAGGSIVPPEIEHYSLASQEIRGRLSELQHGSILQWSWICRLPHGRRARKKICFDPSLRLRKVPFLRIWGLTGCQMEVENEEKRKKQNDYLYVPLLTKPVNQLM